jgi:hypothetical protein
VIPGWIHEAIDHMLGGKLDAFAGQLMTAGRNAAPGTLVEIHIWGSLRLGFHTNVGWWEEEEA